MKFLLLVPALLAIAIEDFRHRSIRWLWLLPIALYGYLFSKVLFIEKLANILIILVELIGICLYFSLKSKKWVNIFRNHLGTGDFMFLLIVSTLFYTFGFLYFLIFGLMLALIASALFPKYIIGTFNTIPLAGLLAIQLLLLITLGISGIKTGLSL